MVNDFETFRSHLSMLLRDHPRGTSADLTDQTVAFWDGHRVLGMYLCADEPGLDEEFDLSDEFLGDISEVVDDWISSPRFTFRPELVEWLKDAPPFDASV